MSFSGMDIKRIGKLVCAKIICKGFVGTTITLSGGSLDFTFGGSIVVNITSESKLLPGATDGVRYETVLVPVAPVVASVVYQSFSTSLTLNITTAGAYYVGYTIDTKIYEQYTSGTYNFVVPSGVTKIYFLATGAGGGGNAGGDCVSPTGAGGAGGAGGGGGQNASRGTVYDVTAGSTISMTIGAGGAGGTASNKGGLSGGATVISGIETGVTLAGGRGGGGGGQNAGGSGGAPSSGGSKAQDGKKGYTFEKSIEGGEGGTGGSGTGNGATATGGGGGGGGGNSVNVYRETYPDAVGGRGGDGAGYTPFIGTKQPTAGQDATRGAGGGGGGGAGNTVSQGAAGGRGGDGFVVIFSRVYV